MEAKFNSFVESFYIALSEGKYEEAKKQVDIMKKWYTAFLRSIQGLEDSPSIQGMKENSPLFQQMINHCDKRLSDTIFKEYKDYIKEMKCFPSDFWNICEHNDLKDVVVNYFNQEGLLQIRTLIEGCSQREMEAYEASQHVNNTKMDISAFIVSDLDHFCTCTNYIIHIITICQTSPYSTSLQDCVSQIVSLLHSAFHYFEQGILSLEQTHYCQTLISKWQDYSPIAINECHTLQFNETSFVNKTDLEQLNSLLSMITSFLHCSLTLQDRVQNTSFQFPLLLQQFKLTEITYTQICIYTLLQSDYHMVLKVSTSFIEDAFYIIRDSVQRQFLAFQPIVISSYFSSFFLPYMHCCINLDNIVVSDDCWLGTSNTILVCYDGLHLCKQYCIELNEQIKQDELHLIETELNSMIDEVEMMIMNSSQVHLVALARDDWSWRHFNISAEEYDSMLLEPILFSSISQLPCDVLLTDSSKLQLHNRICKEYCNQVLKLLKEKTFTECGGLFLKKCLRIMQEDLTTYLSEECIGFLELRYLHLFSVLVSLPKDILDVAAICESAQISIEHDELQQILSLRISDVK